MYAEVSPTPSEIAIDMTYVLILPIVLPPFAQILCAKEGKYAFFDELFTYIRVIFKKSGDKHKKMWYNERVD